MQTHLSSTLGRRTFIATIMTTLAASVPGCDSPARFFGGDTEYRSLAFEYRREASGEWIAVSGVPEDAEAVFSIDGSAPTTLAADGIIAVPAGLSGSVMFSVRWTRGSVLVRSGFRNEMIDLDEKRQPANASA